MKEINIADHSETIIERTDYPVERCKAILQDEVTAILGYGPQGRGQGLNMRDQGFKVFLGVRRGRSWDKALEDGWVEGETLFETEEAAARGTILQYLLSDAGQIQMWPMVQSNLKPGNALYFSHGFGIVFKDHTSIVPGSDLDVILVAPKGSGLTVRNHFLAGRGINASFAIHQDATGNARDRTIATAFAIGSGHLFETSFENEVYSDLTGERCVLMGMLQGRSSHNTRCCASRGTRPPRRTTRPSRRRWKASTRWCRRRAWTGCTRTARPPRSAARSTGRPSSTRCSSP